MSAEAAVETVESVVEEIEDAAAVVVNNPVVIAAAVVVGLAAGGFGGYIFAKRKLETQFEERLDEEIEKARNFYRTLSKKDTTPQDVAAEKNLPVELGYATEAPVQTQSSLMQQTQSMEVSAGRRDRVEEAAEAVAEDLEDAADEVRNIFDNDAPEWDQARENRRRNENSTVPYIISKQEYLENDPEFEQVSLTYFEGDDVLSDDRDMPVPDPDELVGEDNLARFGYGSNDRNIVYVRNGMREMDFEIVRHTGDYSEHVAGFLQHSSTPLRKFRRFDE